MHFVRRRYFKRVLRPINRLELTPATVGRTMAAGLFWGLSATVGLQVIGVTVSWLVGRWVRRPFYYPVAMLLTAITNPLTVAPMYSLYFMVGSVLLWRPAVDEVALEALVARLTEAGAWQIILDSGWFFAVCFVGSLPFAVLGTVAGYYFGRYVGYRLSRRRFVRRKRRADVKATRAARSS